MVPEAYAEDIDIADEEEFAVIDPAKYTEHCRGCGLTVGFWLTVKYCKKCILQMTREMQDMRREGKRKQGVIYSFEIVDDFVPKQAKPYEGDDFSYRDNFML